MDAPAPFLRRAVLSDRGPIEKLQSAAYAPMAVLTARTPIPLMWDYGEKLRDWDVWVSEDAAGLTGVLMLHLRDDDLYLESIAVHPRMSGTGLGGKLLAATDAAALAEGRLIVRLLTNEKNVDRIELYKRKGFVIEFIEEMADRRAVHMVKHLTQV
jgi:GNAT superfamily N-acetyltransferase